MSEKRERIVARIERALGLPGLASRLATELRGGDLASLLLEVQRTRALAVDPRALLAAYERDLFVAPAPIDARRMLWIESACFDSAPAFDALELSPLAPLATCSGLAPVDPANVVATIRGTEVLADPSNVLALEAARRRRSDPDEAVDLCASTRVVRAQRVTGAGFSQHFGLFALCSAGRAQGEMSFELRAMREHLAVHLRILCDHSRALDPHVVLVDRSGRFRSEMERDVVEPLATRFAQARFSITTERHSARTYYPGLSLVIEATDVEGQRAPIADGGAVDWTAQLMSDRKERCFISGIGIERLCTRFGAPA